MPHPRPSLAVLALLLTAACSKGEEPRQGPPPPPPPTAKPAACTGGGGKIADAASAPLFPQTTGSFCLDPNGGDKVFGEGSALPIDRICDLFDGECEIYKGYGVRRVVEARYVDGGGTAYLWRGLYLGELTDNDEAAAEAARKAAGEKRPPPLVKDMGGRLPGE